MRKTTLLSLLLLYVLFFCASCSKNIDMDDYPQSSMRSIIKFTFLPTYNPGNIFVEHKGVINQATKTITIHLHPSCNLTALRPEITLSPLTKVEPGNYEPHDFSSLKEEYVAVAENGKKGYYDVICVLDYKFKGSNALAVILPDIINPNTERPLRVAFNNRKAVVNVPSSVDLSALKVSFEIEAATSSFSTWDKDLSVPYDFSDDVAGVNFKLTSESKSTSLTYNVIVKHAN